MDSVSKEKLYDRISNVYNMWLKEDAITSTILVIMIKKLIDERNYKDIDDLDLLLDIQRLPYSNQENLDVNVILKFIKFLEAKYFIPREIITSFIQRKVNEASWIELFIRSMNLLQGIDLKTYGMEIAKTIQEIIVNSMKSNAGQLGGYISNPSIGNLQAAILNIKDGDTFCDGSIGYGLSTVSIINNKNVEVYGVDIEKDAIRITAMLFVICGMKNFKLYNNDYLEFMNNMTFDKLAMDVPLKGRDTNHLDLESSLVSKAVDSLKPEALATIVVSDSVLFRTNSTAKNLRIRLINTKCVKAVIQLPQLHFGSNVRTLMLVLCSSNDKTLFIDISSNENFYFKENRSVTKLTDEGITSLAKIVENKEEIQGLSKLVNIEEIIDNEYNLIPSQYLKEDEVKDYKEITEINTRLNQLYEEFDKITINIKELGF